MSSRKDRTKVANLTNDVHPLLTRDKFPDYVDYDAVFLQPARLATRMLSTPQAQHYFLALIVNSKHISALQGAAKYQRHRCQPYKNIQDLGRCDRRDVEGWLRKMADTVSYEVRECLGGACAHMTPRPFDDEIGVNASIGYSVIRISRSLHYDPLRKDLSAGERVIRQFDLAVTLLHELAHAAVYAITANELEDFFENSIVAEAGFEFESRLFGFVPAISNASPLESSWISWPSRSLLPETGYDLNDICCDQSRLEKGHTAGEVEIGFMETLFQVEFWENTVAVVGSSAVLAPSMKKNSSSVLAAKSILDLMAMDKRNAKAQAKAKKAEVDAHEVRKELRRRAERLKAQIRSSIRRIAREIRIRKSAQAELEGVSLALTRYADQQMSE